MKKKRAMVRELLVEIKVRSKNQLGSLQQKKSQKRGLRPILQSLFVPNFLRETEKRGSKAKILMKKIQNGFKIKYRG